MSLLIKGMEMPKSCFGCPFFAQVNHWNKNDEANILSKCKRTGEFTWESVNGYLPNCPLVPVPPHGRWNNIIQGIIPSGQCSNCGAWDKVTRFCPNCGSRMEKTE